MATGTVKWFNDSKGYGFISPDEGEKDLFVHHSNIAGSGFKSLVEGAKVEFEAREGEKVPRRQTSPQSRAKEQRHSCEGRRSRWKARSSRPAESYVPHPP